ncbi:MAG: amino acid permease [Candidatus Undinarchaeales archaeon]
MSDLKRNIKFGPLLLLTINAIIGTGIFFVPAIAAGIAGNASIISWLLVGVVSVFIAMCFAELSSIYPKCGGVYEYAKNAFGETTGFITGWMGWVVANITVAMLVVGSFSYLAEIVPIPHNIKIIIAIAFVVGMNLVNIRGINLSIKVLLFFAIATILALWFLISWGVYSVNVGQLINVFNVPSGKIFIAMVFILETFFGWETVSYLSEETENPKKVIPKAMIYGTICVVLFAIAIVAVVLGVLPWETIAASESPLVKAAHVFMPPALIDFVAILIFLNIIGGATAWIITTPRLIFALSRDGLLPKAFSKVHKKYKTPVNAIILQTILTSLILLSGSYFLLLKVLLPLAIVMYIIGAILPVAKLRISKPTAERPFKVPFGTVLPIFITILLLALMAHIELDIILMGGFFILLGLPMYYLMALSTKPKIVKEFIDISDFFMHYTYDIWIPEKIREKIKEHLGELEGKKILDFGCSTGNMSVELAKEVGKEGQIHATEISMGSLNFAKKHAEKHNVHKNIIFLLEDASRRHDFHKTITEMDGVVSIGTLGYLNEPDKVLHELNKRVKPRGKVYFVDYDHVFRVLPTQKWLSDDKKIKKKFKKHGFDVKIEREPGMLWEVIHIYGKKKKNRKKSKTQKKSKKSSKSKNK